MEKNYFITGGANGIGLEYTKIALMSGGKVVMTDVNTSLGEQREKELQVIIAIVSLFFCYFRFYCRMNLVKTKLSS